MKIRARNLVLLGVKIALSAGLLWLVLTRVHVDGILTRVRAFDLRYAAVALVLWLLNLGLASWRWSILSLRLIPFGQALRYTWIGFFYGSVLPGAIAGDVAKGISLGLKDRTQSANRLTASIFIDKLVGVFMLLLFFCGASGWLLLSRREVSEPLRPLAFAGLGGALLCLGGLVFCWKLIGAQGALVWIDRLPFALLRRGAHWLFKAFAPYRHENRAILKGLAAGAVIHSVVIAVYWLMFVAVDAKVSLAFAAAFYSIISFVLMVPLSISGIGLRDVVTVMLFSAFHLPAEAGVAVGWLLLALNVPLILVGATIQTVEFFRHGRPVER